MKVIIVGGGPAGMMCAIMAAQKHEVVLVEKNKQCGRKLLLTGLTRCNITNNKPISEFVKHLYQGRFMYSALSKFGPNQIIDFFKEHQLELVEEDRGRMFPKTNKAQDVLEVLVKSLNNVKIVYETEMTDLMIEDGRVIGIETNHSPIYGDSVVLATGGLSYPQTGSDGHAHRLLKHTGIEVTPPYPVEAALLSDDEIIKQRTLQGLSLENVTVRLKSDDRMLSIIQHDLLFTHFGFSGPAALALSEHAHHQQNLTLSISLINDFNEALLFDEMIKDSSMTIRQFLRKHLSKRMVAVILEQFQFEPSQLISLTSRKVLRKVVHVLLNFEVRVSRVMDIEKAFVTGGGVSIKEINPQTFELKRLRDCFVIGELMDVHGSIGGYNLTVALASGFACGQALSSVD